MLKKILELVFLMCLTSGLLYAGEVALVTDLSGDVTASWLEPAINTAGGENTEEQRGRHEWKVEIAEMLPDGAEVKTGAESSLTMVHLADNTEYRLEADSFAKITAEGVEGSACASVPLQLVSTNIQLGGAMQHQVGAVVADREHKAVEEAYEKLAAQDSGSSGASQMLPEETKKFEFEAPIQPAATMPPPAPKPAGPPATLRQRSPVPEISIKSNQFADNEESAQVLDASADSFDETNADAPVAIETGFALPLEMIAEICSNETMPGIEGYELTFGSEHEGWLAAKLTVATIDEDIALQLKGDLAHRALILHVEADTTPSVAYAWRLEKSGLLAQAASVWMALQAEGMDAAKVALHLKRIKGKLLTEQN